MRRHRHRCWLGLAAGVVALTTAGGASANAPAAAHAPATVPTGVSRIALSPGLFDQISTGIAQIRTFKCGGRPLGEGTGFLVGSRVVMTARHVVRGACRIRVLVDGKRVSAHTGKAFARADVATLRLQSPASGYVFSLRSQPPTIGTRLAALSHPLGTSISLTQGKVVEKLRHHHVPLLVVRLLSAEGASGSPLVDGQGNVAGILQLGFGGTDIIGQRTSGVIAGVDLPAWQRRLEQHLCRYYPSGGIPACAPIFHVQSCWTQYTGGSWSNVNPSAAATTFTDSDLLSRNPKDFWTIAKLKKPPSSTINGTTLELIQPNGTAFGTESFDWSPQKDGDAAAYDLNWTFSDGSLFFQNPASTGSGTWTFRWSFPDGETCNSTFTVAYSTVTESYSGSGDLTEAPFTTYKSETLNWTLSNDPYGCGIYIDDESQYTTLVDNSTASSGSVTLPPGDHTIDVIACGDWTVNIG